MLLVTQEAPYFFDRKFDFYMIQGFEYVLHIFPLLFYLFLFVIFFSFFILFNFKNWTLFVDCW